MSLEWYPFFIRDYRRDTLHLSLAQDGAYRRLIDEYMVMRTPLPDNDVSLARILGVALADWIEVAVAVRTFFRARDGQLFHKRCDRELRAQDLRKIRNSEKGKKAAFAKAIGIRRLTSPGRLQLTTLTLQKNPSLTSSEQVVARATPEARSQPPPRAEMQQGQREKTPSEYSLAEIDDAIQKRKVVPCATD